MSDKMREAFERRFPVPNGIYWDAGAEQYEVDEALFTRGLDSLADIQQARLQGYIAALTQQPESEPVVHVFADDLKKLQTSECAVTAYSVAMVDPDRGETVALHLGAQPSAQVPEGWIDPHDKSQRQWLPWIKERVMVVIGGEVREGFHNGGSWQLYSKPGKYFPNSDVTAWIYPHLIPAPSIAEKRVWISCEERLPTESDADFKGNIWAFRPDRGDPIMIDPVNVGLFPFTHWMTTGLQRPEPPEVQS